MSGDPLAEISNVDERRRRVVAHRGLWADPRDRNSMASLRRAVDAGFGVETDIRDCGAAVSVRHDPQEQGLDWLTALTILQRCQGQVALNVKADGLPGLLGPREALPNSVFFFDMSWPETLKYVRSRLPVALRMSECERLDLKSFERLGVPIRFVLDAFESDWWLKSLEVQEACLTGQVMLISPELHGRNPEAAWEWAAQRIAEGADLSVCTDRCFDFLEVLS